MIDRPGIYEMTAEEYHADPCPTPSLSSSIARELLASSPRHAWFAHPRLNEEHEPEEAEKFDLGTATHAYLLQGETGFVLIDAPDFKTTRAKTLRDEARAAGKVPLLSYRWDDVMAMAAAANRQLDAYEERPRPFSDGKPEQTIVWQEDGIWCRARVDWLHDNHRLIDDLKTTAASANPDAWDRTLYGMGGDVQAAFYLRGLKAVTGRDAGFRFVPVENYPPFALSVIALLPDALDLAEKKVRHAIRAWRHCLESGDFPGYPRRTCWISAPPWEVTRWLEKEHAPDPAPESIDDGRPLASQLFGEER